MKQKITIIILLLASIPLLVNIVYAPWSTLGTGYAITSNYHGVDVLPGTPVTVTAGTLDPNVVQITFRWHMPNGSDRWETVVPVAPNGTTGEWNNGTVAPILYAQDTKVPDVLGDWGVQAFFQDSTGREKAGLDDVLSIKATSFNSVPVIPLIGTAGSITAMLAGLGFFTLRKKRK